MPPGTGTQRSPVPSGTLGVTPGPQSPHQHQLRRLSHGRHAIPPARLNLVPARALGRLALCVLPHGGCRRPLVRRRGLPAPQQPRFASSSV